MKQGSDLALTVLGELGCLFYFRTGNTIPWR